MSALSDYQLTYGGTRKSFAKWGIQSGTFQHAAGGGDLLSFTCLEPLTSAPKFGAFQHVAFHDQDGVQRFYGQIFPARRGRTIEYQCVSGNFWLERTPVRQPWKFLEDDTFTLRDISLARLGGERNLADDLGGLINQCADQWDVPLSLDLTDVPDHKNPEDVRRDMKGTELVRYVAAWAPYLDYRYNYASGVELDFFSVLPSAMGDLPANRHSRRTVSVDLIQRSQDPTFDPMHRDLVKTLRIYWKSWTPHLIGGTGGTPVLAWTRDTDIASASPDNGSDAIVELTIDLRRPTFNGTDYDDDSELKVTNLAERLLAPYSRLWKAMSWSQKARHCAFDIIPGELWDCDGADPAYADAGSVCQVVTHNLKSGLTVVQCGAPKQLGFYNPRLTNRLRNAANEADSGGQTYGFEPKPGADSEGEQYLIQAITDTNPPNIIQLTVRGTSATIAHPIKTFMVIESGSGVASGKYYLPMSPTT